MYSLSAVIIERITFWWRNNDRIDIDTCQVACNLTTADVDICRTLCFGNVDICRTLCLDNVDICRTLYATPIKKGGSENETAL